VKKAGPLKGGRLIGGKPVGGRSNVPFSIVRGGRKKPERKGGRPQCLQSRQANVHLKIKKRGNKEKKKVTSKAGGKGSLLWGGKCEEEQGWGNLKGGKFIYLQIRRKENLFQLTK